MHGYEAETASAPRRRGLRDALVAASLGIALGLTAGCGTKAMSARERAHEEWRDGDYEAAAAAFESYLAGHAHEPEAEEARFLLADTYHHNLKRYDRARDQYALFLEQYPRSARAYEARQRLAEVFVALESPREAIAQYELLLQEHPATPEARKIRSTIADIYYEAGDFNQAEVEYLRVAENAPYDELTEQALLRLGGIYSQHRRESERAIPIYDRIAASTGDRAVKRNALHSLSQVYVDLFRFDEAIATLRRIDDPEEARYVAERSAELERQKQEHADAPAVEWKN